MRIFNALKAFWIVARYGPKRTILLAFPTAVECAEFNRALKIEGVREL